MGDWQRGDLYNCVHCWLFSWGRGWLKRWFRDAQRLRPLRPGTAFACTVACSARRSLSTSGCARGASCAAGFATCDAARCAASCEATRPPSPVQNFFSLLALLKVKGGSRKVASAWSEVPFAGSCPVVESVCAAKHPEPD